MTSSAFKERYRNCIKTFIENEKRLLGLTCDEDAREMLNSAEENRKDS